MLLCMLRLLLPGSTMFTLLLLSRLVGHPKQARCIKFSGRRILAAIAGLILGAPSEGTVPLTQFTI